ncbi:MAG: PIN domain-containing protein [Candidatus Poribacteria bacterium]|nr:PIN domain-containing protein [Candidatus Poribacteria bacterium]
MRIDGDQPLPEFYWDACCFVNLLTDDPQHGADCKRVYRDMLDGKCRLVTSAITVSELSGVRRDAPVSNDLRAKIRALLQHERITLVDVDGWIAERALELSWDYGLNTRNALHLASAAIYGCETFETNDDSPLRQKPLRATLEKATGMTIRAPHGLGTPAQGTLFD